MDSPATPPVVKPAIKKIYYWISSALILALIGMIAYWFMDDGTTQSTHPDKKIKMETPATDTTASILQPKSQNAKADIDPTIIETKKQTITLPQRRDVAPVVISDSKIEETNTISDIDSLSTTNTALTSPSLAADSAITLPATAKADQIPKEKKYTSVMDSLRQQAKNADGNIFHDPKKN